MKKIISLFLIVTLVAGCSFETGKVDPDKEKFTIDFNDETDKKDEN